MLSDNTTEVIVPLENQQTGQNDRDYNLNFRTG